MTNEITGAPTGNTQGRDTSGRYSTKPACEFCGKPVTDATGGHYSDDETCNTHNGLGLMLCGRKRCMAKRENLSVEARLAAYASETK